MAPVGPGEDRSTFVAEEEEDRSWRLGDRSYIQSVFRHYSSVDFPLRLHPPTALVCV